jgi:hypothetical protein
MPKTVPDRPPGHEERARRKRAPGNPAVDNVDDELPPQFALLPDLVDGQPVADRRADLERFGQDIASGGHHSRRRTALRQILRKA